MSRKKYLRDINIGFTVENNLLNIVCNGVLSGRFPCLGATSITSLEVQNCYLNKIGEDTKVELLEALKFQTYDHNVKNRFGY